MKKNVKRFLAIAICCAAVVSMMVGCSKTGVTKPSSSTLTYAIWDTNQAPGMKAIAAQFEKANPTVKVNVEVSPWDQYWTKLQAAASGGALPDIFWMHTGNFLEYADAGMFLDLTDKGIDMNNFPKDLVSLYTYKGKIYGVPKDYDTIGLWYNKKMFDAKGIAYPDSTWDWTKLETVAKQLTDTSKGIFGFLSPVDTQSDLYNFIYQNGGYPVNSDYTKSGYDLPATKEAVQFAVNLSLVDKVSPTPAQFANTGANQYMESGKAAMGYFGSWMVSEFNANDYMKANCDVAPIPHGKNEASIYNGLGNVGSAKTKYKDAAYKFLEYLGTLDANHIQSQNGSAIPAYNGETAGWVSHFSSFKVQAYPDMLKIAVLMPTNSMAYSKWTTDETDILPQIYAGKLTVDAGCDQLAQKMNADIAAAK